MLSGVKNIIFITKQTGDAPHLTSHVRINAYLRRRCGGRLTGVERLQRPMHTKHSAHCGRYTDGRIHVGSGIITCGG